MSLDNLKISPRTYVRILFTSYFICVDSNKMYSKRNQYHIVHHRYQMLLPQPQLILINYCSLNNYSCDMENILNNMSNIVWTNNDSYFLFPLESVPDGYIFILKSKHSHQVCK